MPYVILQHCCNDAACVSECPVDCIHPRPDEPSYATAEMLYIDPEMCINCGSCQVVCPVDAIRPDCDLTSDELVFSELNAAFYEHEPQHAPAVRTARRGTGVTGTVRREGNVAIDIARLLLSTPGRLSGTDMAQHALERFSTSRIREVVVVGRRGPAEAAFTNGELLGLLSVPELDVVVAPEGFDSAQNLNRVLDFAAAHKAARLSELIGRTSGNERRVVFRFCASPERLLGRHQVSGIRLVRNALVADGSGIRAVPTDEFDELDCGLVIRSVGYRGNPLGSVPFDSSRATIPNRNGHVVDLESGEPLTGTYVTGWIKRGPSGVIGTNKQCARQTVACLVEDYLADALAEPSAELPDMATLLPAAFDVRAWNAIDQHERSEGERTGRPRVKLVDSAALPAIARQAV
jgi:ferredoxin--NADP+ reductase